MIPVTRQLALKIKLEGMFRPELNRVFNLIAKDFKIFVAETGLPPDISAYKPVFEVLLRQHFKRVQRNFRGAVKQADDTVQKILIDWTNLHAPEDAEWIAETTKANMTEAIQQATNIAAEELQAATARGLSANATAILKRKLRIRLDNIINTETQKAAESAKFIEAEVISELEPRILGGSPNQQTNTRKQWMTVGDKRVRPAHVLANKQIKNLTEPFVVGGEYLMHPGDDSLGATLGNLVNCLHPNSVIDFASPSKLMRRWYDGKMVTIKTHCGHEITVTPNHPILTEFGFIGAGKIKERFGIIGTRDGNRRGNNLDVKDMKPTIEQIYNSLNLSGFMVGRIGGVVNFHGDISNKGVNVVTTDGRLLDTWKIFGPDPFREFIFESADVGFSFKPSLGQLFNSFFSSVFKMSIPDFIASFMCGGYLFFPLFRSHLTPFKPFSFALGTGSNTIDFQNSINGLSLDTNRFVDFINRMSSVEKLYNFFEINGFFPNKSAHLPFGSANTNTFENRVKTTLSDFKLFHNFCKTKSIDIGLFNAVDIKHFDYSGYVYNLEDDKSYYICNGLVNHNCRCISKYIFI